MRDEDGDGNVQLTKKRREKESNPEPDDSRRFVVDGSSVDECWRRLGGRRQMTAEVC